MFLGVNIYGDPYPIQTCLTNTPFLGASQVLIWSHFQHIGLNKVLP